MEQKVKVSVKIFGQDYVLSGDSTREHMIKVAGLVDAKMQEIAQGLTNQPLSSLAVLSAVNIADDFFKTKDETAELARENQRLAKDTQHYVQLWDEAKNSFIQYKEDAHTSVEQYQDAQKLLAERDQKIKELTEAGSELQTKYNNLAGKNEDLLARMKAQEETKETASSELRELTDKCKEMENSFFDLQMENIQLKGELDRCKKMMD